jgi:hypothetical protein
MDSTLVWRLQFIMDSLEIRVVGLNGAKKHAITQACAFLSPFSWSMSVIGMLRQLPAAHPHSKEKSG